MRSCTPVTPALEAVVVDYKVKAILGYIVSSKICIETPSKTKETKTSAVFEQASLVHLMPGELKVLR